VLTSQTVSLLLDVAFAVVYLVVLVALSPTFGAVVLAFALVQMAIAAGTTRPMHRLMQRDLAADADQQGYLVEALKGVATLKAAGAEDRFLDHWANLFFRHLDLTLRRARFSAVVDASMTALRTLAPLALLWFGARQVLAGELTLGTMLALAALASSFLAPLSNVVSTARQLQTVGARLERITEVLETEREQEPSRVRPAPRLRGAIEVEGVSFRYRPDGPLVLREVSFSAAPGQKVALVGRTGSGKSTLAALLLGLYRPTRGRILYDGAPLEELEYRSLRTQLGAVLQESYLFSGSIRSNIAFNDPGLSFERVVEAARFAAIDRDVEAMPMGYETLLPEGGGALSGGERQRLSIARAVEPPRLGDRGRDRREPGRPLRHASGHRPPPVDGPRRRPHPGPRAGLGGREGHPRRAHGPGRPVRGDGPPAGGRASSGGHRATSRTDLRSDRGGPSVRVATRWPNR
jgi:ABC-type bacteriocin/lantibiotic exporter with double-glycine peptidase domain